LSANWCPEQLQEQPGGEKSEILEAILVGNGARFQILGGPILALVGRQWRQGSIFGAPGPPKIDQKSIKMRVTEKHEILHQNVSIVDHFL